MKLLRIAHERCDEFDAATYIWVPDEYTDPDRLYEAMRAASRAYDADLSKYMEARKATTVVDPGYSFDVRKYPDAMTIGDARGDYEAKKAAHKAAQDALKVGEKSFEDYVLEAIPGSLSFWYGFEYPYGDGDGIAETVAYNQYWGHRHGTPINYGETKIEKDTRVRDSVEAPTDDDHEWHI